MTDPATPPRAIPSDARPHLPRGVRLHHDRQRDAWILLAPETLFGLNQSSLEILRRCDGQRSIDEIIAELAGLFGAEPARLAPDVQDLLGRLHAMRLLDL